MSDIHSNISIFVPHLGCPHQCSFCNQKHITKQDTVPKKSDIDRAVEIAKCSKKYNPNTTEIAFFGGSFTAIERQLMLSLLSVAYRYVISGDVCGVRVSTRPDAVDKEIIEILLSYGVTTVELGAQSMDDAVLLLNERGHTAEDVKNTSTLIKSSGIKLGLQMMTGLYGSSDELDIFTANEIVKLMPDFVRVYPTITLKNTRLADYYNNGKYTPPTLSDSVELSRKICGIFNNNNIPVIRLGLHTIDENSYVAGPWHPAYKELCDAENFKDMISARLDQKGTYEVLVNPKDVSKAVGQSKSNISFFKQKGYDVIINQNDSIKSNQVSVKRV